jgi:IS5 family transposase
MQNPTDKTSRMHLSNEVEVFAKLVKTDHPFRKLDEVIEFESLIEPLRSCYSDLGRTGFDIEKGFKALLIQFWEDYSDREMESAVQENIAVRWFCGFDLLEPTPDHTYFCKLRRRIGTKKLADLFNQVNDQLREQGLFGDVFTFVDASSLITKTKLWEERDRAIEGGANTLNNLNVKNYSADKDANFGCKGSNHYWFGYKRHQSVDMRYGLINKVAVTPASVLDYQVLKNICPKQGLVFMDKLYDCREADLALQANGCFAGTIRKNNRRQKNRDLDRWRSKTRMPFEGTFSKLRIRTKFRGLAKVQAQCFLEAICHNLKKAVKVLPAKNYAPGMV